MGYGLDVNKGLDAPGNNDAVQPDPNKPQPRPGFAGWWDALGDDKKSALQMAALTTGLSMMAQGPSRVPVSAAETFGHAGLTGLNTYMARDAKSREMAMKMAELGLKTREVAAKEGELGVNQNKQALEARLWEPGTPSTTTETPTGRYTPALGAQTPNPRYNLGGPANAGLHLTDSANYQLPQNYGGLGNPVIQTVTTPGKQAGLKAREAEATIDEKQALAQKNRQDRWDIKDGYVIDKSNGNYFRANPNKEIDKVVDAKDKSVILYKDGTREEIKHGLSPEHDLAYQEMLAQAKAIGKAAGEAKDPTYSKIEGKVFSKFMDNGFQNLTPQEQQIVMTRLEKSDPDMAQAAKVVNNDVAMVGKPAAQVIDAQVRVYGQIKAQKGTEPWKATTDHPAPSAYRPSLDLFDKQKQKPKPTAPLSSFDR